MEPIIGPEKRNKRKQKKKENKKYPYRMKGKYRSVESILK